MNGERKIGGPRAMKRFTLPLTDKKIEKLKAGDEVLLDGLLYTARDVVHKRLVEMIKKRKRLPIDLKYETFYYTGPTPAPAGRPIGSCGPTTSSRMDRFTPALLRAGLKGMIGKGERSDSVIEAIKRYHAIYFIAPGGAGAYLAQRVKESKVVAFKGLGPEAIHRLKVAEFPVIVCIDAEGRDIYAKRRRKG